MTDSLGGIARSTVVGVRIAAARLNRLTISGKQRRVMIPAQNLVNRDTGRESGGIRGHGPEANRAGDWQSGYPADAREFRGSACVAAAVLTGRPVTPASVTGAGRNRDDRRPWPHGRERITGAVYAPDALVSSIGTAISPLRIPLEGESP